MSTEPQHQSGEPDFNRSRRLFRYLLGEEWQDYRAILRVFANTFFSEFDSSDIATELQIDTEVARERLESLRRWGNLTDSSSVGNPANLDEYNRKRNRYLITRAGQEVYDLVEIVLSSVELASDVQAARLEDLHRALESLQERLDANSGDRDGLAADIRAVFDIHERFTSELTMFFAELNEWQNRYDLTPDEVQYLAGVLVDYVSEQLTIIERNTLPISRSLDGILPRLDELLPALHAGLADRVDREGLAASVAVRRLPGTETEDWQHLAAWFVGTPAMPSRLSELTRQALAAVRTLTANVSRLSRLGVGATSRRTDFVRLAQMFDRAANVDNAHQIAAAAFGLGSCRRLGTLASDAEDPVASVTSWADAPRAVVPVSLRERGDTTPRGSASPIRDRRREREQLQIRSERDRVARENAAAELLARADEQGRINGVELGEASFTLLRGLISRSGHGARRGSPVRYVTEMGICCKIERSNGEYTIVRCPLGRLTMQDLIVSITAADAKERSVDEFRSVRHRADFSDPGHTRPAADCSEST